MNGEPMTREARERITSEVQYRALDLDWRAADEDTRTVAASMSSETPVRRWFGNEILSHDASAVNLERINGGALPLLWGHDTDAMLGAAEGFRLENGRLVGQLRFSKHSTRGEVWEQIREGMPLGISIGYRIDQWQESADSDDVTVTRWTLHEVSVVSVPADHTVGIGRSLEQETTHMSTENSAGNPGVPASAPAVETGPAHVRLVQAKGREEGRAEERGRIASIRELFVLPGFQSDDHIALREWAIDSGASVEQCREELLKMAGSGVSPVVVAPPTQRQTIPQFAGPGGYQEHSFGRDSQIRIGEDEADKFHTGALRAIELRAGMVKDRAKQDEYRAGNEFVGRTMVEVARICLERSGVRTNGWEPIRIAGAALTMSGGFVRGTGGPTIGHGVADFANILLDASNKSMMTGWTEAPETWSAWCSTMSIADFKTNNLVNLSNFGDLDVVPEYADYKYGTLSDVKETIQLRTYGKLFSISRQAIVNDDLSAFTSIPAKMGRAAARMVGDEAYGILTSPPTLNQTGRALFHATDGNIRTTTGAGAPSVTTLDTEFTSMGTKTDPSGSVLNIRPRYLICPLALENTSRVLAAATYDPAGTAGTLKPNPFAGRFDVVADARLDAFNAAGWFVAADPSLVPTVVVGFLNGVQAPYLEQVNAFTQDGVAFKVRLECRAAAADFRGLAYNDGAP